MTRANFHSLLTERKMPSTLETNFIFFFQKLQIYIFFSITSLRSFTSPLARSVHSSGEVAVICTPTTR